MGKAMILGYNEEGIKQSGKYLSRLFIFLAIVVVTGVAFLSIL